MNRRTGSRVGWSVAELRGYFYQRVREGCSEEVTFELTSEGQEGTMHSSNWRRGFWADEAASPSKAGKCSLQG